MVLRTKHSFDERFFEKIDTPAKAYWLGFIIADGGVYRTHLRVSLEESDGGHVFKLRTALGADTVPIFRRTFNNAWKTKPQLCFDVSRAVTVADLSRLGVVPNKTHCGWMPDVTSDLEPHLWRGIFDGDGHISKLADGMWGIGLAGTKETMERFVEFVTKQTGHAMTIHPIARRSNLPPVCFRVISQGMAKPKAILATMYADDLCPPDLVLSRKKKKADELLYDRY